MRGTLAVLLLSTACAEGGARPRPSDGASSLGGRPSAGEVQLPFVVDDHFIPAGPMGDAIGSIENQPNQCLARPAGAQGGCYAFPVSVGGALGWSGLYWLESPNQWGSEPGVAIQAGARKVRFFAASSEPIQASFLVGGIVDPALYPDGFTRKLDVELTRTLTEYEISLDGASYDDGVQGGFGWTVTPTKDITLYLDSIRWQ